MSCLEGDYSIYIEVTCCDSKGDVKKEKENAKNEI